MPFADVQRGPIRDDVVLGELDCINDRFANVVERSDHGHLAEEPNHASSVVLLHRLQNLRRGKSCLFYATSKQLRVVCSFVTFCRWKEFFCDIILTGTIPMEEGGIWTRYCTICI